MTVPTSAVTVSEEFRTHTLRIPGGTPKQSGFSDPGRSTDRLQRRWLSPHVVTEVTGHHVTPERRPSVKKRQAIRNHCTGICSQPDQCTSRLSTFTHTRTEGLRHRWAAYPRPKLRTFIRDTVADWVEHYKGVHSHPLSQWCALHITPISQRFIIPLIYVLFSFFGSLTLTMMHLPLMLIT